jgi:hypothetical protein
MSVAEPETALPATIEPSLEEIIVLMKKLRLAAR